MKPEEQGVVDRAKFHCGLQRQQSGHVLTEIEWADAHCTKHGDFRALVANTSMPGTIHRALAGGQITIFCMTCGGQGAFDESGKPV